MYNRSLSGSHNGTKPAVNTHSTYTGGNGWIEREIHNVKKSYEEEIKMLEVREPEILEFCIILHLCALD